MVISFRLNDFSLITWVSNPEVTCRSLKCPASPGRSTYRKCCPGSPRNIPARIALPVSNAVTTAARSAWARGLFAPGVNIAASAHRKMNRAAAGLKPRKPALASPPAAETTGYTDTPAAHQTACSVRFSACLSTRLVFIVKIRSFLDGVEQKPVPLGA